MKKIIILLCCFLINSGLFAQTTKKELKEQIKIEIQLWINNITYDTILKTELDTIKAINDRYDFKNKELEILDKNFCLYLKGKEALDHEYENTNIDILIKDFSDVMKNEQNEKRKENLSVIHKKLYDYNYAYSVYKDFQSAINEITSSTRGNKWSAIQKLIREQKEDGYIEEIENIPYLKTQYENYLKNLKNKYNKQPVRTTSTRK